MRKSTHSASLWKKSEPDGSVDSILPLYDFDAKRDQTYLHGVYLFGHEGCLGENMKLISKTAVYIAVLALASMAATSAFAGPVPRLQNPPQKTVSDRQLNRMIASAKTPAEHRQLAQFLNDQAQLLMNQLKTEAAKVRAYKETPFAANCALCVDSSYSVDAAIRALRNNEDSLDLRVTKLEFLAHRQEQLANLTAADRSGMGY